MIVFGIIAHLPLFKLCVGLEICMNDFPISLTET